MTRSDAQTTVSAAFAALFGDLCARLERNIPIAVDGGDPEGVHQARVACRRIRSTLRIFGALFEPSWAERLRTDLAGLAADLGAVRDADVLLARLLASAARNGVAESDATRLLSGLERERDTARERLLARLGSDENRAVVAEVRRAARRPAVVAGVAALPALTMLSPIVASDRRGLRRRVRRIGASPSDEQLHRLRIAVKRCRYATMALVPLAGADAAAAGAGLGTLQDTLGEHQDASVAARWLREHAEGESAFSAGVLHARELDAMEAARARWPRVWREAMRPRLWSWL